MTQLHPVRHCFSASRQLLSSAVACASLALAFAAGSASADDSVPPLGWYPRDQLSAEEQEILPDFCSGNYRVPEFTRLPEGRIEAEADESTSDRDGNTVLSGDVIIRQTDQRLSADTVRWNQTSYSGQLDGSVSLASPDMVLYGESATILNGGEVVNFYNSEYSVPARHFRGTADSIETPEENKLDLTNATFTFCEPGQNDWDLAASELHLNQETGIGSAWHTRLRIKEVPVMYIPYYRFPIDDRRMTGFLDPSFTVNGEGQAEDIQIPFYWNIAPNADATIIGHHILDRGMLWETQFRHKTALLGDGELNYGYLGHDATEDDERWLINYQQSGTFGHGWSHDWVYNHLSDKDYLSDMSPAAAVDRTTHMPRRGVIQWNQRAWHFDITAEGFQTIDDSIALRNRPYRRLPQLNLSYSEVQINNWQFGQKLQTTRFTRDETATIGSSEQTLSGFDALNGDRILSDSKVAYPMEWPFGFLTPAAEYRYRAYNLTNADDTLGDFDTDISHGAPRYSVDGGLYFDREFNFFGEEYQQTLEPRLYWVKSPYISDQNEIPNFDSTRTTVTYASLFQGDRFTGGDRLADLDQISAGITTRFINASGMERFRASAGRIWYNGDRLVQLNGTTLPERDTQGTSSLLGEVEWSPGMNWSLYHTLEWNSYHDFAVQRRYGARYASDENRFFNLATNTTQYWNNTDETVETTTRQIDIGAFWALNDRWALVGRQLRDMRSYDSDERSPISPVLESLIGFEYQNCCWRTQIMYRKTSPRDTDAGTEYSTKERYGLMLSIQLKGLSTFGSSGDSIISEGITGYSRRKYHDY